MKEMPLSFSQLQKFYDCGEMYRRRYVEGEREAETVAAWAGTAFHRAVEGFERAGRPDNDLMKRTMSHFNRRTNLSNLQSYPNRGPQFYVDEAFPFWSKNYIAAVPDGESIPWIDHECSLLVRFASDLPPIAAIIDQVFLDSQDRVVIRDLKTGKPKPEAHALQLELYTAAWNIFNLDFPADYAQAIYVNEEYKGAAWISTIVPTLTQEQLSAMLRSLFTVDDFPIQGPLTGACNYCSYRPTCPYGYVGQVGALCK